MEVPINPSLDSMANQALSLEAQIEAMDAELKARIIEADWLKAHYDEALRAAMAEVEALQARLRTPMAAAAPAAAPSSSEDEIELKRLRQEVERLTAGEQRYLDRIKELKDILAAAGVAS